MLSGSETRGGRFCLPASALTAWLAVMALQLLTGACDGLQPIAEVGPWLAHDADENGSGLGG